MILLNFSHPLTDAQRAQLEALIGHPLEGIHSEMPQFDHGLGFAEQIRALVDRVGLDATEWQMLPVLVNPPGYALATAVLMAELHGRIGHFPPVVRLRPIDNGLLTEYKVAEVVNLQTVRDYARQTRQQP